MKIVMTDFTNRELVQTTELALNFLKVLMVVQSMFQIALWLIIINQEMESKVNCLSFNIKIADLLLILIPHLSRLLLIGTDSYHSNMVLLLNKYHKTKIHFYRKI